MAQFEVRGPDGGTYQIDAPDEASALAAFQEFLGQQAPSPPSIYDPQSPMYDPAAPPPADGFSSADRMAMDADAAGRELAPEYVASQAYRNQPWWDWFVGNTVGIPGDNITNAGEALGSWLSRAGESATLGLLGDEANALAYSVLTGRTYDSELERFRQNEEDLGTFGRLSADLAGGLVPAAAGVGIVGRAAQSLPARMGVGAATGAGAGATQGFMEGEGGFENRALNAGIGGALGFGIGGALPAVAEIGRSGIAALRDAWRSRQVGSQIGDALGVSPETGRVAAALLGADDQAAMAAALNRAGPDAMLGDASGRAVGALDTVLQTPVPGAQLARSRIDARAAAAGDDMMDALRGGQQGPFMGPIAREQAVDAGHRAVVNPAYQKAYDTAIDYASPQGMAIEDLISRVPPGPLKKAVDAATDRMIYDGMPPQVMATIGEDGAVSFTQQPSVIQLDYLKRAFDEIAEDGKDALTGKMTSDAAFASRVARDIREATKEAVPAYGDALSVAATGIRERGAIRDGAKLIDPSMTPEQAASIIKDATPAELRLMQEGVIAQIENRAGQVRAVASDRMVDAREAAKVWGDLSSRNTQDKMRLLFGDQWEGIKTSLDQAGAALGLRADVSTNSRTAGRLFTREAIEEATAPGALQSGRPLEAAKNLIGGLTGASPEAIARANARVQSEIAELLTRQGGAPQQAISAVARALAENPMALGAGGNTAVGLALGGATALPAIVGELGRGMIR